MLAMLVRKTLLRSPCEFERQCFGQNLSVCERDLLLELIRGTAGILDAVNVPWIPVAGNLLAVYRHGKIIIPWDDDFDITIRNEDASLALEALAAHLPSFGATLTKIGNIGEGWGFMFKVHFERNGLRRGVRTFPGKEYTWPFIDVFIGGTESGPMGVKAITDEDLPLKEVVVDGVKIHVPSRGPRSFESFAKRDDLMKKGMEQSWSHRFEADCGCKGAMERSPL